MPIDIETLLREHGSMLSRIAASYEAEPRRREDLLQEINLALWRALPQWRGDASLRTFAARIAHNRAVDHLVADVRRRGRRLRLARVAELIASLIAIGLCGWAALWPETSGLPRGVPIAGIALVLGCQCWSLWIRRRQCRDSGLDARALLSLEQERILTSRRYWRFNIWVVVLIWIGLSALVLVGTSPSAGAAAPSFVRPALISLLVNLPVVLGFALYAGWSTRRNNTRLMRLRILREELDAD